VPALVGLAAAVLLELGDRSSCPVAPPGEPDIGAACVIGPTYAWLHPSTPGFNHVFGALVFLATLLLPAALTIFLALFLRRHGE
jgi:hypothetical protein